MPAKTIRKPKWSNQQNFADKPYVMKGFDNYLGKNKSADNIIKLLTNIASSRKCNNIGIFKLTGVIYHWNDRCNIALLHMLKRKRNIFSLNFAEGEVGKKNENPVMKFVETLLSEDKHGKLHLFSTGLVLTWFGNIGNLKPRIYSAIRKYVPLLTDS